MLSSKFCSRVHHVSGVLCGEVGEHVSRKHKGRQTKARSRS